MAGQGGAAECEGTEVSSSLKSWYYLFLFGQLVHGIGASPLYTLGFIYLDESVTQKASPVS